MRRKRGRLPFTYPSWPNVILRTGDFQLMPVKRFERPFPPIRPIRRHITFLEHCLKSRGMGWMPRSSTVRPWISTPLSNRHRCNLDRTTSWNKFGKIDLGSDNGDKIRRTRKATGIWMKNNRYILIVGCGRLGSHLANQLSRDGNSVVVIDKDETTFSMTCHRISAAFA
jgi:hypothetical protein